MDVDMRSPSFRTLRSTSGIIKRPRSPPSPSPYERPHKRVSLGGINNSISYTFAYSAQPTPEAIPLRARQASEDWVSRTRGLRIDRDAGSPLVENGPVLPPVAEMSGHDGDQMNMDHDEPMSNLCPPPNSPQPSMVPIDSASPSIPAFASPSFVQTSHSPSAIYTSHSSHTVPSTSSLQSFSSSTTQDTSSFYSSSPLVSSTGVQVEPQQIPLPSSPSRKQRFTMGPRSDCEKCRLGVPGHWSHLN